MHSRFGESRLIARVASEMQLGALVDANRFLRARGPALTVTIDRIVFFLIILCESVPASDEGERGGVSINAAASSLDRSFETARRHINALIAGGLCERVGRAVRVPPAVLEAEATVDLMTRLHDRLVGMVADLGRLGVAMPAIRSDKAPDPTHGAGIALGLTLSLFEHAGAIVPSWLDLVIGSALISANVRAITCDPALSRRYAAADAAPPEALRQPVAVAAIARALHLPYATVRRHVEAMVAKGLVRARDGGYMVERAAVETETYVNLGLLAARNAMTAIERLARCGFDVTQPTRHALGTLPEPISFA